ncbi:MAG: hypothetical protein FJX52_07720 [Alphaproteobacteria bacterium]|nr:hypothetical protein [Alphaproteobacteria bacterium]
MADRPSPPAPSDRKAKLAARLRENLKKRKEQAHARRAADPPAVADSPTPADPTAAPAPQPKS